MSNRSASVYYCEHCGETMRVPQRPGRPPKYCSARCRGASYRLRRSQARTTTVPRDETLTDLALDLQEEVRHVVRLVAQEHDRESSIAAMQATVRMRRLIDAVTAGVVQQARSAGASWATVGHALVLSSETARRVYRKEVTMKMLERAVYRQRRSAQPAPAAVASRPEAAQRAARIERSDNSTSNRPVCVAQLVSTKPAPAAAAGDAQDRFVAALSLMQRRAEIPLRRLGQRTGVSASYVSRVLAGARFPSRQMTYRLAQECGAAEEEIMALWEQAQHARSRLR